VLRLSAFLLIASLASSQDLKRQFMGRSGAALVYDLKEAKLIGTWNESRANT
jgi:hypothetical protein